MMKRLLVALVFVSLGLLVMERVASADLVVNGNFQAIVPHPFQENVWITVPSWDGWTESRAAEGSNYGHSGLPGAPSMYQAFFAGPGPGSDAIGQAIQTVAGQSYRFSFWLAQPQPLSGYTPGDFEAYWNGASVLSITDTRAFGWTLFTFIETATGTSTAIGFSGRANTSSFDSHGFFLTDVSATPVPLPGAFALLGSALVSIIGWRRLRKN